MLIFREFQRKFRHQAILYLSATWFRRAVKLKPALAAVSSPRRLYAESLESRRLLAVSPLPIVGNFDVPHFFGSQSILTASMDPSPGELPWDPLQAEAHQRDQAERLASNPNYLVDDQGYIVGMNPYTDPMRDSGDKRPEDGSEPVRMSPFPPEQTFLLHSLPGASKTIYLDFDGHTTTGTLWNSNFNEGNPIVTPAFNFEGSPDTFTNNELFRIQRIWERVAEDFLPFHVNVTTEEPPLNALRRSGAWDTQWGIRVVIGPNTWFGPNVGGVAYLTSFNWSTDTPAFVFSNALGNSEKNIAEAISHEVGHTLGLNHHGVGSTEYYSGHGSGATGWAPIMGVGYNRNLTQWSRGEYPNANNSSQNDLAIITTQNGFSYRADDHGNTMATATPLSPLDSVFFAEGIIERNTDVDFFSFSTTGGNTVINVDPFYRGPNLDILANLYDSSGSLVASSNPVNALNASFFLVLPSGNYYLSVQGTGKPASGNDFGYSDYGSLGYYSIQAFIPQEPGSLIASLNDGVLTVADSSGASNDMSLEITNDLLIISDVNERFESVPDGATLSNGDRTLTIPISLISNSVVIDLDEGNDNVTVGSWMSIGSPGLTILGGASTESVSFIGGFVPGPDRNLQVSAESVSLTDSALVITTGTGAIDIAADQISIASSANLVAPSSSVSIAPLTSGREIHLGAQMPSALSLTTSEFSRIGGQSLSIGAPSSGAVTIVSDIVRPTPVNMELVSGSDIVLVDSSIDTGGGTLLMAPGSSPAGFRPQNGANALSVSELSISGTLVLEINGSAPSVGYDQLNVVGSVDLIGTDLALAGSFSGVTGNETFTIVSASNIIGTFEGLPNESQIEVDGKPYRIVYSDTLVQLAPAPVNSIITNSYVFHADSAFSSEGISGAFDTSKSLAKEGSEPVKLTFDNLINSSRGINGIVFDIDGLPSSALSQQDFIFQVSPQSAFNAADHPPADWQTAPVLPAISVLSGEEERVVLQWPDNAIANRWLRITVLANSNTGLAEPATYYIGHLLGETTGPENDVYTVTFADISLIRGAVGQTVGVGNLFDIDKSGIVNFADITAMRGSVGAQLTNITIPAAATGMSSAMSPSSEGSDDSDGATTGDRNLASAPVDDSALFQVMPTLLPQTQSADPDVHLDFPSHSNKFTHSDSLAQPSELLTTVEPVTGNRVALPIGQPTLAKNSVDSMLTSSSKDTNTDDAGLVALAVDQFFGNFDRL